MSVQTTALPRPLAALAPPSLEVVPGLVRGRIALGTDGGRLRIVLEEDGRPVDCDVLHVGAQEARYEEGDVVLVWIGGPGAATAVVLGRIGPAAEEVPPVVVSPAEYAARPERLVIEAQGELVLRNGQARITLGADGDIDIACASFATRSRRLLRLLSPLIKLN